MFGNIRLLGAPVSWGCLAGTKHHIKGLQIQMEFLFFIPMKQVPQGELKPRSLNEQSSWLLKPAYKYKANFGKCQMSEKNVLTNVIVRLWY